MDLMQERSREYIINNIIKFLVRLGYFEMISNPQSLETFIQNLTLVQFKNLLATFNAKLRNIPLSSKSALNDETSKMVVGDWIAPSIEVRERVLQELLNALKNLKSNEERALLLYYSLLNLHMFEDGNGRTARLFYNLINGNINLIDNIDWYLHDADNHKTYNGTFDKKIGLMRIEEVRELIGQLLPQALAEYPFANIIFVYELSKKTRVYTLGKGNEKYIGAVPIPQHVAGQLIDEEKLNVYTLFLDNNGRYTIGGLLMLIMAVEKGQIQDWSRINQDKIQQAVESEQFTDAEIQIIKNSFAFYLGSNPQMFDTWTADDYRKAISIGEELKYCQLMNLIKVFTSPESYKLPDGQTYLEIILKGGNIRSSCKE